MVDLRPFLMGHDTLGNFSATSKNIRIHLVDFTHFLRGQDTLGKSSTISWEVRIYLVDIPLIPYESEYTW